ncbi:hypothetical protein [Thiosulfativibrio zosterae]|uniref:Uncharacterized protein n=1 Tax=Thiosulfativibrio zosterae TaxID=2675053 RepID=A0A6F8PLR5_9GAMM|nr:hypothetical protein [Thiosulfativibrio zosterae]BBP42987.1 hypothetical protein THMIRHAT_07330 [Thiosulfativibrio zosterae]
MNNFFKVKKSAFWKKNGLLITLLIGLMGLMEMSVQTAYAATLNVQNLPQASTIQNLPSTGLNQIARKTVSDLVVAERQIPIKNIERYKTKDISGIADVGDLNNLITVNNFLPITTKDLNRLNIQNEFLKTYHQTELWLQNWQTQTESVQEMQHAQIALGEWQKLREKLMQLIAKQEEVDELLEYLKKLKTVSRSSVLPPVDIQNNLLVERQVKAASPQYFWPR